MSAISLHLPFSSVDISPHVQNLMKICTVQMKGSIMVEGGIYFPTVDSHCSANSHFCMKMFIHNAQTVILPKAVLSPYAKQSKKPTQRLHLVRGLSVFYSDESVCLCVFAYVCLCSFNGFFQYELNYFH